MEACQIEANVLMLRLLGVKMRRVNQPSVKKLKCNSNCSYRAVCSSTYTTMITEQKNKMYLKKCHNIKCVDLIK